MEKLLCPACKGPHLDVLTDSSTKLEVDSCPECLGTWFDRAELAEFYRSPELIKRLLPVGGGSLHHTYEISATARACPRCRKGMERPHVGGIAVDVCRDCRGIWFDHGELRKITDIHKSRGLKGDEEVSQQIRDGMKKTGAKGGSLDVLGWFFNSFLGNKLR